MILNPENVDNLNQDELKFQESYKKYLNGKPCPELANYLGWIMNVDRDLFEHVAKSYSVPDGEYCCITDHKFYFELISELNVNFDIREENGALIFNISSRSTYEIDIPKDTKHTFLKYLKDVSFEV